MMRLQPIRDAAARRGLGIVGGLYPGPEDSAPKGTRTLLLLGPDGPKMWEVFSASDEATDGKPHPLDRWSRRVISVLAVKFNAQALFPFGGPPYNPFQHWAARGEGAVTSPVAMQVSPTRGLWASYRGALALTERVDLPGIKRRNPCDGCPAPCLTACPVEAFAGGTYNVPTCTAHVNGDDGAACRKGCLVRRACPAGSGTDLPEAQRVFHMRAFLRAQG